MVLNRFIQDKNYNSNLINVRRWKARASGEENQNHNEIFFEQICRDLKRRLPKLATQNTKSSIHDSQCKIGLYMLIVCEWRSVKISPTFTQQGNNKLNNFPIAITWLFASLQCYSADLKSK